MYVFKVNTYEEMFFLKNYFYDAFSIYLTSLGDNITCFSYHDINEQKETFNTIFRKISKNITCDSVDDKTKTFILPSIIALDDNEKFWFEFIINMKFNDYYTYYKQLTELCTSKNIPYNNATVFDLYVHFQSIDNIENARLKFINDHKIANTPALVGYKAAF
jgi:hypothetical protein